MNDNFLGDAWWELHESKLRDFSRAIEQCIVDSNWDELSSVLALRQAFLEDMFSKPVPDQYGNAIRRIVAEILEQDAMFQNKILDQKAELMKQLAGLKRGQVAMQVYNGR